MQRQLKIIFLPLGCHIRLNQLYPVKTTQIDRCPNNGTLAQLKTTKNVETKGEIHQIQYDCSQYDTYLQLWRTTFIPDEEQIALAINNNFFLETPTCTNVKFNMKFAVLHSTTSKL
jgi:hypothetical protein